MKYKDTETLTRQIPVFEYEINEDKNDRNEIEICKMGLMLQSLCESINDKMSKVDPGDQARKDQLLASYTTFNARMEDLKELVKDFYNKTCKLTPNDIKVLYDSTWESVREYYIVENGIEGNDQLVDALVDDVFDKTGLQFTMMPIEEMGDIHVRCSTIIDALNEYTEFEHKEVFDDNEIRDEICDTINKLKTLLYYRQWFNFEYFKSRYCFCDLKLSNTLMKLADHGVMFDPSCSNETITFPELYNMTTLFNMMTFELIMTKQSIDDNDNNEFRRIYYILKRLMGFKNVMNDKNPYTVTIPRSLDLKHVYDVYLTTARKVKYSVAFDEKYFFKNDVKMMIPDIDSHVTCRIFDTRMMLMSDSENLEDHKKMHEHVQSLINNVIKKEKYNIVEAISYGLTFLIQNMNYRSCVKEIGVLSAMHTYITRHYGDCKNEMTRDEIKNLVVYDTLRKENKGFHESLRKIKIEDYLKIIYESMIRDFYTAIIKYAFFDETEDLYHEANDNFFLYIYMENYNNGMMLSNVDLRPNTIKMKRREFHLLSGLLPGEEYIELKEYTRGEKEGTEDIQHDQFDDVVIFEKKELVQLRELFTEMKEHVDKCDPDDLPDAMLEFVESFEEIMVNNKM